ncbi:MAG: hypothetical protein KKC37_08560 [Proteobacteria bacterium]|nr:hypothetical protein [Pseudomonadota bacterium]
MAKVVVTKDFPSYEDVRAKLAQRLPQYNVGKWWGFGPGVLVKRSAFAAALVRLREKKKVISVGETWGSVGGVILTGGLVFLIFLYPKMAAIRKDVVGVLTELYG